MTIFELSSSLYSCRKFFGVPDGAYLSTNARLDYELETDKSAGRMTHILGRCEGRNASDYYNDFRKNDESFNTLPIMSMSWLTHNLLGAIDYDYIKSSREANYRFLDSILGSKNILKTVCPAAPFAYPFYVSGGIEIRKKLAARKIYIATLWPYALTCGDDVAEDYAANILPLPCDQRYNQEDMKILSQEVLTCIN